MDWGQIRVDQNISASDTLFGRYTTDKSYLTSAEVGSSLVVVFWRRIPGICVFLLASYDQFATISENHIFSPTVLNQFRFSYSRTNVMTNTFQFYSPMGQPH